LGHEVIVANARNVRLLGESRKKDDRLDAQTLARLARIDGIDCDLRRWGLRLAERGGRRKEASHRCDGEKAGGVAASPVGERRSVRTATQQQWKDSCGSRVRTKTKSKTKTVVIREKTKSQSRVPMTAFNAWPTFHS
jgi:hypothetical protein